jgi:AraC-like DNA-binding protein
MNSITEIAFLLGFTDASNFARASSGGRVVPAHIGIDRRQPRSCTGVHLTPPFRRIEDQPQMTGD